LQGEGEVIEPYLDVQGSDSLPSSTQKKNNT
jgi:hypothetical protein